MTTIGNAVEAQRATPAQVAPAVLIAQLIERQRSGIERALPAGMNVERFTRVAITAVKMTPALLKCDSVSLLGAVMLSAQLGLEPGPLGHAYLVPFGTQVQFIPGYKGLIDLAMRSGKVTSIYAHEVRVGDEFDFEWGLEQRLVHKPAAKRGEVTHVYAVGKLAVGDPVFMVLTRDEVEGYRARSKAGKSGPWVTDWTAMALKTAVRRLVTWLPLSVELATATQGDALVVRSLDDLDTIEPDYDDADIADAEVVP
jgi:recombination protein RecT